MRGTYEIPFPAGNEFILLTGYTLTQDATHIAEACNDEEWNWLLAQHDGERFTHLDFMPTGDPNDRIRVTLPNTDTPFTWEQMSTIMWKVAALFEKGRKSA